MRGIGFERSAVREFGDENDVAGVIDVADVEADLDMVEAFDQALQTLEGVLDL